MREIKEFLLTNQVRMRIFNQMFAYVIHLVQGFLNLMPPFIRNFGFRLMLGRCGKNVFFDYNIYLKFPWLIEAGNDVAINRGVQFFPAYHGNHHIRLGNDVYLAPNVCFFASGHDINDLTRLVGDDIVIGDHVWIGANTIVLPGVTIGESSVIGAGSVVTKSIPPNSIAVGNPARVIRTKEQWHEGESWQNTNVTG
jgi:acetyltransferase-like isoleucine patch superfamily enzyme